MSINGIGGVGSVPSSPSSTGSGDDMQEAFRKAVMQVGQGIMNQGSQGMQDAMQKLNNPDDDDDPDPDDEPL